MDPFFRRCAPCPPFPCLRVIFLPRRFGLRLPIRTLPSPSGGAAFFILDSAGKEQAAGAQVDRGEALRGCGRGLGFRVWGLVGHDNLLWALHPFIVVQYWLV